MLRVAIGAAMLCAAMPTYAAEPASSPGPFSTDTQMLMPPFAAVETAVETKARQNSGSEDGEKSKSSVPTSNRRRSATPSETMQAPYVKPMGTGTY